MVKRCKDWIFASKVRVNPLKTTGIVFDTHFLISISLSLPDRHFNAPIFCGNTGTEPQLPHFPIEINFVLLYFPGQGKFLLLYMYEFC